MEPFPRTMILHFVSCSNCLAVSPRGPSNLPTKLYCVEKVNYEFFGYRFKGCVASQPQMASFRNVKKFILQVAVTSVGSRRWWTLKNTDTFNPYANISSRRANLHLRRNVVHEQRQWAINKRTMLANKIWYVGDAI